MIHLAGQHRADLTEDVLPDVLFVIEFPKKGRDRNHGDPRGSNAAQKIRDKKAEPEQQGVPLVEVIVRGHRNGPHERGKQTENDRYRRLADMEIAKDVMKGAVAPMI